MICRSQWASSAEMIELEGLTKQYGRTRAVDDLTFTVKPGVVTGFLGPNGAGKSTTMRMLLGLDRPTRGQSRVNGHSYASSSVPLREVGALLDARDVHGGQSVFIVEQFDDTLGPWAGYGVFTLGWVVPLMIGTALMVRRDAA